MRKTLFFVCVTLLSLQAFSQTKTVTGTVTDQSNGQPIAGVTVTVKGTDVSTSSQADGSFRITVPANARTLTFTSVGYQLFDAPIGDGIVNVQMMVGSNTLTDVVITGYTTQTKRQVAGSTAKIKGEEIKLQPVGSFDKLLQGKVAGLLAQSGTGQPGAAAEVTIRGKGSINGTNTPLYIVDGVQVNAGDFSSMNPGDFESYDVLKDASSTAIYGSRGANGVIVVTTKRGAVGQTRVNYDFQYGYSELPKNRLELMNSEEKLQYEFYDRDFGPNPFGWSPTQVDSLKKINHNIKDVLFHKGITQQHQLSMSGGNDRTRFFLSGSIFDQQGIVRTTGLKRYTGRVNVESTIGSFRVGVNATIGSSKAKTTREEDTYVGSPLNAIRWFNPYLGLYDANGDYQDDYLQNQPNPLRELLENYADGEQLKGVGSVFIDWNIPWVKGLKARTVWGADYTQNESFNYYDRTTDAGSQSQGGSGEVDRSWNKNFRTTGTTSLGYRNTFGDHDVSITLFNEIIKAKGESFGFAGYGITGPFKNEAGITAGSASNGYIPVVTGFGGPQFALLSWFADANYGFKSKYYINATVRRDGSSRLTKGNQWSNFASAGVSWIMSDENFMQGTQDWLNVFKLKASYGSVGSQGIGNFTARELLNAAIYNGRTGLSLANLETNLTWERKLIFNAGFEFTMFKGRFGGVIEYYNSTTKDLFLDRQLSRTSGFRSITNNLGRLQNQGIEVTLNGDVVKTKDFTWSIEGNFTYNKNKLLDQNGQDENITSIYINKVGQPINSIYIVRFAGVDKDNGDALYYDKDGKTTNVYDPGNRAIIGPIDPPYFGGVTNTFTYKGLSVSALFSYAFGNYIYNNERVQVENPIYWYSNLTKAMLTEWRNPGDVTNIPSAFSEFQQLTTRYVEKGNYLRLRNVMVSYDLPNSLLGRAKIKTLRVFAQGQNLYVWHNFQGYDPEVLGGALGGGQYPQLKTVTFGLSLGL